MWKFRRKHAIGVGLLVVILQLQAVWIATSSRPSKGSLEQQHQSSEKNHASPPWKGHVSGVILFYHVPKTGGTTIEKLFNTTRVFSINQFLNLWDTKVKSILSRQQQELFFIELHGNIAGIQAWSHHIHLYQSLANIHGTNFFAFTLIREPIAFTVSYFTYFHHPSCEARWCEADLYDLTETNLLQAGIHNRQCEIFFHGQRELKKLPSRSDRSVTRQRCEQVQATLRADWYVGTTETMSVDILPKLSEMVFGRQTQTVHKHFNHGKAHLEIGDAVREQLERNNLYDLELYASYAHH